VKLYPRFQQFFREHRPPTLAVWGTGDPFFVPAGAHAFTKDNPDARVMLFETGHFALETHSAEIGAKVVEFLRELAPAEFETVRP
jgi:pimeloyl-ACP methyl ester carboxylesterase